jgi:hypothetical protein
LPASSIAKEAEIQRIVKDFPEYTEDNFKHAWLDEDWAVRVEVFVNKLLEICDLHDDDRPERYLDIIVTMVMNPEADCVAEAAMLRGSLFMSFAGAYYYLRRVSQPEKFEQFDLIVRDEVKLTLKKMADNLITFISDLNNNHDQ